MAALGGMLIALPALAAPPTLTVQGRLLDSTGAPVNQQSLATFSIYDDADATNPALWDESVLVQVADGYYAATLGLDEPITGAILANPETLYLGVSLDTAPELVPRQPLSAVPYAVTSVNVNGGTVNASTVTTNTLTVGASAEAITDTKVSAWDNTAAAWGTSGISIGNEVESYQANGASASTNLGAADGRRMCFLVRVQLHDTMANESLADCYVRINGGNWQLYVNSDNGNGDPDTRCSARCMSW